MPRLEDIAQELLPETQNIPEDMREKAIRNAARTLCQRTLVWRAEAEGMMLPGIREIELDLPRDAALLKAHYLTTKAGLLRPHADFSISGTASLKLSLTPAAQERVTATVSLEPSLKASFLDDTLWDRWGDVILHGARYRLKSMHGREWFQAQIALYHQQEFETGVGRAAHEALRAYKVSPVRTPGTFM